MKLLYEKEFTTTGILPGMLHRLELGFYLPWIRLKVLAHWPNKHQQTPTPTREPTSESANFSQQSIVGYGVCRGIEQDLLERDR